MKIWWFSKFIFIFLLVGCTLGSVEEESNLNTYEVEMAQESEKTIRIGILLPLSGVQQSIGTEMQKAIEMAFEGVLYKIGEYDVALVYIDSEGDEVIAAQKYEQAIINDEFDVGFSGWNSNVSIVCMEIAAQYKIPHFFAFGAAENIDLKYHSNPEYYKYWVGKGWPAADKLVAGYVVTVEEAIEKGLWTPSNRNIVVFKNEWQWASSLTDSLMNHFVAAGWNISAVVDIGTDNDLERMDEYIAAIRANNPSIIMGTTSSADTTLNFIKNIRQNGIEALFIADGYGQNSNWFEMAEGTSNFILDQIPQFTGDRAESFIQRFNEANGYDPSPSVGGMAYDWANYFIKVMQYTAAKYETLSSDTIMQCADEYLITGALTYRSGTVHDEYMFSEDTFPEMAVGAGYYMFPVVQYIGDQAVIVWPASKSVQQFQYGY